MSRTYHHGEKALTRKFNKHYRTYEWGSWWVVGGNGEPTPPKKKRHEEEWWPMRTTPSWWVREMMTRPQRAETRRILHQITKLDDLEDAPFLPHPKKPHLYFW